MPKPTEAIQAFLTAYAREHFADLYSYGMEVQVNVAQDGGDRIQEKSGYTGRIWSGFTDGIQTWKSFRIPWKAGSEPEYHENDRKIGFDLKAHAEGIGMTGWNWKHGVSKWVAFDFDNIISHSEGLSADDLQTVKDAACKIPWVTVVRSTSGNGLHLYVFLDDVPTANHTEHAALARSILSKMSAVAGFDFNSKVDANIQNFWVWHRKMTDAGLLILKQGGKLLDIPINWRDHLVVIKGRARKSKPTCIKDQDLSSFEEVTGQQQRVKLDPSHLKLMDYLQEKGKAHWWDSDRHILICHTFDLKIAHDDLGLRGIYDTVATGTAGGDDWNCFLAPLASPEGAWIVRRYSPGIQEAGTWQQDDGGYTFSYFNRSPSLRIAARTSQGIEGEKQDYHFSSATKANTALLALGAELDLPEWASQRPVQVKQHKDGRLIVYVRREASDRADDMTEWREDKGWWKRVITANTILTDESGATNFDNIVRHLVDQERQDSGWVIKANDDWYTEPLVHIRAALKTQSLSPREIDLAIGKAIMESWMLVSEPFQDEFLGNRRWNRGAVQCRFVPVEGKHPTWDKVLGHVGGGLDNAIKTDGWCSANGIVTGGDYLRTWTASLFQRPKKPLPYLFFYSKAEATGKSTLHEALSILMTDKGLARADTAITSQQSFNAELRTAVLCVVQETDLSKSPGSRNRIKDWVTSPQLVIHPKGHTPYSIPNTMHFIHTANDPNECPVFPGDTRITVGQVSAIDIMDIIARDELFKQLEAEAPAFMHTILKLDIPYTVDRLGVPVVNTIEKRQGADLNRDEFEVFLDEVTHEAPGEMILYSELWARFQEHLDPQLVHKWSKIRMGRSLPEKFPKGRVMAKGAKFYVGNLSFTEPGIKKGAALRLEGEKLV